MENIIIALMLAAMIHGHVTGGEKQEVVKDNINWDLAGNFRTESTPNTVQWVIITDAKAE
jgi:hypothetical protein|tara:strand:+ start:1696 stop:1875 length:180 start_codon:yes stop_codon:yes gene_type:complete